MSDFNFKNYDFKPNKKADTTIQSSLLTDVYEEAELVVLGYPDDFGIEKNGGLIGASKGPDQIRKHFYKMTPQHLSEYRKLYDLGNLNFEENTPLEKRHEDGAKAVTKLIKDNKKVLSLGGGHDYGFADGLGFGESLSADERVCIFNFDAHFDLRDLEKGITSGTPFYRLLKHYEERLDLFEMGMQTHCNSKKLFDFANKHENIHTITYDKLFPNHSFSHEAFDKSRHLWPETDTACYISIDIDGFSSSLAPGCSQAWPTGFNIQSFFYMLDILLFHFDVKIIGIYEVSPPLDHNEQTSRLASLIAHRWLKK